MEQKKSGRRLSRTVTPQMEGQTVDTVLRKHLGVSGTVVRRVKCLEDGILLDGQRVFTNVRVRAGQELSVLIGDTRMSSDFVPVPGPLEIVYEDEDLLVVNKAPGVPCHIGPGHYDDTLGNFLAYYYKKQGVLADFHPIHRLDKGTSGLMVVAKHPYAQEKVKGQLHTGTFRRVYLAVCEGVPQPAAGVMDAPIGRVEGSLLAREVRPDGLRARTHYDVLRVVGHRALLRLELDTGRTHQIRVHMAHLGHPLTGDFLYGVEDQLLITRPALHSAALELVHPVTGALLRLEAPLPEDMRHLLDP